MTCQHLEGYLQQQERCPAEVTLQQQQQQQPDGITLLQQHDSALQQQQQQQGLRSKSYKDNDRVPESWREGGAWGLGSERRLSELGAACGISFSAQKVLNARAQFQWLPPTAFLDCE